MQYDPLENLRRSKDAIKAYQRDITNECKNAPVLQDIDDYGVWANIGELIDVLELIHKAQIVSENSAGRLDHVAERWKDNKKHLKSQKRSEELFEFTNRDIGFRWSSVMKLRGFYI